MEQFLFIANSHYNYAFCDWLRKCQERKSTWLQLQSRFEIVTLVQAWSKAWDLGGHNIVLHWLRKKSIWWQHNLYYFSPALAAVFQISGQQIFSCKNTDFHLLSFTLLGAACCSSWWKWFILGSEAAWQGEREIQLGEAARLQDWDQGWARFFGPGNKVTRLQTFLHYFVYIFLETLEGGE